MLTVMPGTTLSIKEVFVNDFNEPLVPDFTPSVLLVDTDGVTVTTTYATPFTTIGTWIADVTVPKFDNKDTLEYTVQWKFESEGNVYRSRENILIEPSIEERESEAVALFGDSHFQVNLPFLVSPTDPVAFEFYEENTLLYSLQASAPTISYSTNNYSTNIKLPLTVTGAAYTPRLLLARFTRPGRMLPETLTFKVWVVTPAMLSTVSQIESFVNKSRISNVIPELRYATSDILLAMGKGIEMFNALPPILSSFTGTNMQGMLANAHITCSCIALLTMQYMAEGSLAFDFSGQSVSLNIDRTQYIDSILGRLDSQVENEVKPMKKLLGKYGISTGDGSIGNKAIGASAFGITTLTLAPTTRLLGNMYSATGFKRYW
jgi:hypothetical protein